jgi:hypothetical protein
MGSECSANGQNKRAYRDLAAETRRKETARKI